MPTYPYICIECEHKFDVFKPVARIEDSELCGNCWGPTRRTIGRTHFTGGGDWTPSFNPGLGCVVKSKKHQREILAELKGNGREMIEIGNEPMENINRSCEQTLKETREKRWSESTEKIMSEVL